jgi:chromosome segregation ATPase
MEILLVFLSTAIGTVAGVIVATVMMQRRFRVAGAGTEIALKTQLQNTEWALSSAGRDVEDLRKQMELRDQSAQQAREELEKVQQQLIAAAANVEKEAAGRVYAEQRVRSLEEQAVSQQRFTDEESGSHVTALETEVAAGARRIEELNTQVLALTEQQRTAEEEHGRQVAALEMEAAAGRQQAEALAAQLTALGDQFATKQRASEEDNGRHLSGLQAEIVNDRRQIAELNAQIAALTDQHASQQQSSSDENNRRVAALETEIANGRRLISDLTSQLAGHQRTNEEAEALLSAERAGGRRLAAQIEELTRERAGLEVQLQKERQSAAEGMQLLQLVQSKLSGAPQNGGNGHGNGNGAVPQLVEAV